MRVTKVTLWDAGLPITVDAIMGLPTIDIHVDSREEFIRISVKQRRLQVIDKDGDIRQENPFSWEDFFGMARHGIPSYRDEE